ncbi:BON domain-containing protein [Alphaproteobacteria bacterium]|jgi:osmotically-inducible protein OsmY|nr:BON domain-containing protein [Alphaproteobacteria bacterium]|tara:strand:- start:1341 stop:1940 length:600 start_codon:yes stop_codon:yes gene_type:complete
MYKSFNHYFFLFLIIICLSGCASTILGGAASVGLASVQERSIKDAAIDLKLELQIQEKLFRANTDKLFVNVDVVLLEQRVMLIGNVESQELRDLASKIAWEVSPKIKNVINEITVGKKPKLVSQALDARISLSLSGLLIGDAKISDINFTHSVSKQVIFLIGIAKDDEELNKVINHARSVKGVKKVISHLMLINDKKRM